MTCCAPVRKSAAIIRTAGEKALHVIAAGLAGGMFSSSPASAQTLMLPPSKVLECMTPQAGARGVPEYDPRLVRAKVGGQVKVELAFQHPGQAPAVRMLTLDGHWQLEEAVREHVQKFRLPCQDAAGEPSRVVLTFDFQPNDGRRVVSLPPQDPAQAERLRMQQCLSRISGPELPSYPRRAEAQGLEGKVLVRMRFDSPTQPPALSFLTEPVEVLFKRELASYLSHRRLPCQQGVPVDVDMLFDFRLEGGPRTVIRDLDLVRLVGSARSVPRPANFDTRTLGCPFDLRVQYRQPFAPNVVSQLETHRPERAEFQEWLSRVELKLDEATALRVLGDTFTLSVPCTTITL